MNEMQRLVKICQHNLKNSKECLSYLYDVRGLTEEQIKQYQLGYFPRNTSILKKYVSSEFLMYMYRYWFFL